MDEQIFIGTGSPLFYEVMRQAIGADLLPRTEQNEYDGPDFMKWYEVFVTALTTKAEKEQWGITFQI